MNAALSHGPRHYSIRRPLAAFLGGAVVALLGGLIGLGGAEFRLPLLIFAFAIYPHRAVRINLLISLATLASAAFGRLRFIESTAVLTHLPEVVSMAVAGTIAAWVGAGKLAPIPKARIALIIALLLGVVALLLLAETFFLTEGGSLIPAAPAARVLVGLVGGLVVGAISSLLGVAGGEFIIPILIFVFGADIRTAGTASVLISLPIVLTGIARHTLTGHFRSVTLWQHLVLPMSLGSIMGALLGGALSAYAPTEGLRVVLALILAVSAVKLFREKPAAS